MAGFNIEVKEREGQQPCWLLIMPRSEIGLPPGSHIAIDMPEGSGLEEAEQLARDIKRRADGFRIAKF